MFSKSTFRYSADFTGFRALTSRLFPLVLIFRTDGFPCRVFLGDLDIVHVGLKRAVRRAVTFHFKGIGITDIRIPVLFKSQFMLSGFHIKGTEILFSVGNGCDLFAVELNDDGVLSHDDIGFIVHFYHQDAVNGFCRIFRRFSAFRSLIFIGGIIHLFRHFVIGFAISGFVRILGSRASLKQQGNKKDRYQMHHSFFHIHSPLDN